MKINKYFSIFFSFCLLILACKSQQEAKIQAFEVAILGNFKAIPDLNDVKEDLEKANLGQENIEEIFPTTVYTFNVNGDYTMTRTGLGLDKTEKGKWSIKNEELKLLHLNGSYRYRLSRTAEGLIYLNDDIMGESMNFTLSPLSE
jgi:hypothetical protein